MSEIDYDGLKKRGFLRQKQDGFFLLRVRMSNGNFIAANLEELSKIAKTYGQGFIHATTRQGLEIPFIKYEDIEKVEKLVHEVGLLTGTSGPRLRTTAVCPGNNWCKSGLVNTFELAARIENELGFHCAMDLPHKFKISISGCHNACTRQQHSEIGIHGSVDIKSVDKHIGYTVYLAGCGGRNPRLGIKLENVYAQDEVLDIIRKTITFFKANAKPRQRLGELVNEIGKDNFFEQIGLK